MSDFFIYLLKVNISLVLFCLAYYLILRRLTFYTLNRFFLMAGIAFSSAYPFVDLSALFDRPGEVVIPVNTALPAVYQVIEQAKAIDYEQLLKLAFWTGVVFMTIRMSLRFFSLYKIHKRSVPQNVINYHVRLLSGQVSTFSFWQNIYLNPAQHRADELAAVLEHEQVHVKQWHTLDILIAELTTVFYWFNPGVWYMRKAVKENVEFITDQKIIQKGIDRKAYQYSMIGAVGNLQPSVLMNNFNLTAIKRRIIMMNSERSSSIQLMRYILLVPVLICVTCAFTLVKTTLKTTDPKPAVSTDKKIINLIKPADVPFAPNNKSVKNKPVKAGPQSVKEKISEKGTIYYLQRIPDSARRDIRTSVHIKDPEEIVTTPKIHGSGTLTDKLAGTLGNVTIVAYGNASKPGQNIGVGRIDLKKISTDVVLSGKAVKTDSNGSQQKFQKIFINDKEAQDTEFKNLKASDIIKIAVKASDDGEQRKGLYIYTHTNN